MTMEVHIMKMIEITQRGIMAELEKTNIRLEKAQDRLEKKTAQVKKLNCEWSDDDHRAWMEQVRQNHIANGADPCGIIWMDKDETKLNGAWFDWKKAIDDVAELTDKISRIEIRLEKANEKVDAYRKEVEAITDLQKKEELMKLEWEQEQAEWLKDGIKLERRYAGETPNGKRFQIYRNSGCTERSWHCFTLQIAGDTIFTSGEFWRCYAVVKNN